MGSGVGKGACCGSGVGAMKCLCGRDMYLSTDGYYARGFEDTWYCPDKDCGVLFYTDVFRDGEGNPLETKGRWWSQKSFKRVFGLCAVIWGER